MDAESSSAVIMEDEAKPARKLFVNEPIPESPRTPVADTHFESSTQVADASTAVDIDKSELATTVAAEKNDTPQITAVSKPSEVSIASKKPSRDKVHTSKVQQQKPVSAPSIAVVRNPPAAPPKPISKPSPAVGPSTAVASKRPDAKAASKPQDKPVSRRGAPIVQPAATATTKMTSATMRKPAALKPTVPNGTGFVKPKPKSPTKPVALPSSLTAHTASSVSKSSSSRQSLSQQAGGPHQTSAARSQNTSSLSTSASTKTLKRQSSTISQRPRPSVGPPPKKTPQEVPTNKKEGPVDESFLARMMRPTQSSSSKTSDKAPLTPPRRTAQRPSTSNTNRSSRRESSVRRQSQQANTGTGEAASLTTDASDSKLVQAPTSASFAVAEKDTSIDSKTSYIEGDPPADDDALSPLVNTTTRDSGSARPATPEADEVEPVKELMEELMEEPMEDPKLVSDNTPEIPGETVQQTDETMDAECTSKTAPSAAQDEFKDHPTLIHKDTESSATAADNSEHAIEAVDSKTAIEASESIESLKPGFAIPMDQRQNNDLYKMQESDASAIGEFVATEGSQMTVKSGSEAVVNDEADEHAAESVAKKFSSVGYNDDQPHNEDIGEVE
jgi:hypothetical protein